MSNTLFDGTFSSIPVSGIDPTYYPAGSQWGFQHTSLWKNPTGSGFSGTYNVAALDGGGSYGEIFQNFTVSQNGNYSISFTLQGTRSDYRYSSVGAPVTISAEVYGSPVSSVNHYVSSSSGSAQTFTFNMTGLVAGAQCSLKLMNVAQPGDSIAALISNIHVDFVS